MPPDSRKYLFTPSLPHTIPPHKSQTPEKVDQDAGADTDNYWFMYRLDAASVPVKQLTPVQVLVPLRVFCTLPWQEDNGKEKDSTQESEDSVLWGSTHY